MTARTDHQMLLKLRRSIEEMDARAAAQAANKAVAAGLDPVVAMTDGLMPGMNTISELFDDGELFVPQLLVAADAFETGVGILSDHLFALGRDWQPVGRVLILTVEGDIHDIGKNIVKTLLVANNFEVIDLGRDVPSDQVVRQAKAHRVDIIVASALMRTTIAAQRDIIRALQEEGVRDQFLCLFGGAPVTPDWVTEIGGDAYADTPLQAVEECRKLMRRIQEQRAKQAASLV
ncbi:MAG: corrinoid protein [Desulfobulbaceae bacterium]|nr:corrinoid protein [Desulfobulbaceae bacterium]